MAIALSLLFGAFLGWAYRVLARSDTNEGILTDILARPTRSTQCMLAGLVCDAGGKSLPTSFSYGRAGRLYRYYVIGSLDPSRTCTEKARRVPAGPLERLVQSSLGQLLQVEPSWERIRSVLKRVELHGRSIQLVVRPDELLEPGETLDFAAIYFAPRVAPARVINDGRDLRLVVDQQPSFRGGQASEATPASSGNAADLLREAHRLLEKHSMSPFLETKHAAATSLKDGRKVPFLQVPFTRHACFIERCGPQIEPAS